MGQWRMSSRVRRQSDSFYLAVSDFPRHDGLISCRNLRIFEMSPSVYYQSDDKVFEKFDNYEIWPCAFLGLDSLGNSVYESCDIDDENIAIWCVWSFSNRWFRLHK